jgi:hypothetical protein
MVWPIMGGAGTQGAMLGVVRRRSQRKWDNFDGAITDRYQFRSPRFCLQGVVNSVALGRQQ